MLSYLAVVNTSNPDYFFSVNMPSYFHLCGDEKISLYMMPWLFADAASDSSWEVEDRSCQQIHVEWTAWYCLSSVLLHSSTRTEVRKKRQAANAWDSKTLITQRLSVPVISPLHHALQRVGWTLMFDHFETVLFFSHCVNQRLCWQINSRSDMIQPISPVFSFFLLFISPTSGMMTVSHNASQRELNCSWAECWKACAITLGPPAERTAAVEGLRGRVVSF